MLFDSSFQVLGSETAPTVTLNFSFQSLNLGSGDSTEVQAACDNSSEKIQRVQKQMRGDRIDQMFDRFKNIFTANLASSEAVFLCKQITQTRNLESLNRR